MGSNPTLSETSHHNSLLFMTVFKNISQELNTKIYYSIFAFSTCFCVNLAQSSSWIFFLWLPIKKIDPLTQLIFTDLSEAFFATILLTAYLTFQFCLPLFCYQIFTFFNPACFQFETKLYSKIALILVCTNFLFHYNFFQGGVQTLLQFFMQFQFEVGHFCILNFQAKIFPYMNFLLSWCFMFQLLVCTLFLSFFYSGSTLKNVFVKKKHSIFLLLICLVAFFFPPDIFIQFFSTCILLGLFELFNFALFLRVVYQEKNKNLLDKHFSHLNEEL